VYLDASLLLLQRVVKAGCELTGAVEMSRNPRSLATSESLDVEDYSAAMHAAHAASLEELETGPARRTLLV
jgi:hypothetical protein